MEKNKTAIVAVSVFAVIALLMVLLIPVQRKNELYDKWGTLAELSETDERALFIIENEELYSERIINYFYTNPDKLDFVYEYAFHKDDNLNMSFTDEELNSETVPALYMSDYRWCYYPMGDAYIRQNGCATVSLTMAYVYLTGKGDVNPAIVVQASDAVGASGPFGGVDGEKIGDVCDALGLTAKTYTFCNGREKISHVDKDLLKGIIDSGNVLMTIMIGETFGNHAIVITGYDGDQFTINDPAKSENTAKKWSFEELENDMFYVYDISY
ncbi:MAG: C39 family peptidase [Oscillospiraceae bacterium]|nr:C39 family peptidase [Oscillospiraceae bacterium]